MSRNNFMDYIHSMGGQFRLTDEGVIESYKNAKEIISSSKTLKEDPIVIQMRDGLLLFVGNTQVHEAGETVTGNLTDIIWGLTGCLGDDAEKRAAHVAWDQSSMTATIEMNGFRLSFYIGKGALWYTEITKYNAKSKSYLPYQIDGKQYINYDVLDGKIQVNIYDMVKIYNEGKNRLDFSLYINDFEYNGYPIWYVSANENKNTAYQSMSLWSKATAAYYVSKAEHPEGTYGAMHETWLVAAKNVAYGTSVDVFSAPLCEAESGLVVIGELVTAQMLGKALSKNYIDELRVNKGIGIESAGKGNGKLTADNIQFSDKFSKSAYKNQVAERGWTNQSIADAINNPIKTANSINKYTGNSVTAYYIDDVHYVALDNITGKVIQVADMNKANWAFNLAK